MTLEDEGLTLDGSQVAGLFRALQCEGAQADHNGHVWWYFPAKLVIRFDGSTFKLTVARWRT